MTVNSSHEQSAINAQIPSDIAERHFDVIVIGAGINGAGIARDAAMRGLDVLLIDKGDIGGATTASPTRLIHGGLRYLEYYEFSLVRESLREREHLLRIAPHLVHPLGFTVPIYAGWRRKPITIRAGMILYDILSYDKSLPRHEMLSRDEVLQREPGLNADGLEAAAFYYDAQVDYPERLSFENALSAREHGATIITHARVDHLLHDANRVTGIAFTDLLGGGEYTARGELVINAAGPWVDDLLTGIEGQRFIGGTKGTHIVVHIFPGAPSAALYVEAQADGRPYFIVPWTGRYLVGTTDIRFTGDLNHVVPDESEISYLLGETARVIPASGLNRDKVLFAYAGVRPLPYKEEGSAGSITRRHIIHDHAPGFDGLVSIIGGKITTYRNLAEETVDLTFEKLGRPSPPCTTGKIPLPGADTGDQRRFNENFIARSELPEPTARRLLTIYGTRAWDVVKLAADDERLGRPLGQDTDALSAEIPFAFQQEHAVTLTDALARRTMLGLDDAVGLDVVEPAAELAQRFLGWSDARAGDEIAAYRRHAQDLLPRTPATSAADS